MDIGYGDDLAGDVDDGQDAEEPNPDSEALDSDDEDDTDAKLGIDKEESEGECICFAGSKQQQMTDVLLRSSPLHSASIFTAVE